MSSVILFKLYIKYYEAAQIPDEAVISGIKQLKYTFSAVILAV